MKTSLWDATFPQCYNKCELCESAASRLHECVCTRRSVTQGLFAPPLPPMAARHGTAQNGAARGDSDPPPHPTAHKAPHIVA